MDQTSPRYPLTCEIDGKTYQGNYWVADKILTAPMTAPAAAFGLHGQFTLTANCGH